MSLLKKAVMEQAYGKVGILGFAGAGKTFTAAKIAIGICKLEKTNKAAFLDTETGSDFLISKFEQEKIQLYVHKSRSFSDLLTIIKECESSNKKVLIIDSITHIWRDLCESYDTKLNRRGKIQFQDWAIIKKEWHQYTDLFVNSKVHIIVCGRAGFEYDYNFDERGNKDLIKTGVKMKVETEFGFEPSLVLDMERVSKNKEEIKALKTRNERQSFCPEEGSAWIHRCHVLKDRFDLINGKSFDYPTFNSFAPHFNALSIGGEHKGIETDRNSQDRFDIEDKPDWLITQKEKKIVLEEIQAALLEKYPTIGAIDKREKASIIKEVFNTGSWTAVEEMPLNTLKDGFERIKIILDPKISVEQIKAIHALFKEKMDEADHDTIRELAGNIVNIDNLVSMNDLSREQATKIINHLKEMEKPGAVA